MGQLICNKPITPWVSLLLTIAYQTWIDDGKPIKCISTVTDSYCEPLTWIFSNHRINTCFILSFRSTWSITSLDWKAKGKGVKYTKLPRAICVRDALTSVPPTLIAGWCWRSVSSTSFTAHWWVMVLKSLCVDSSTTLPDGFSAYVISKLTWKHLSKSLIKLKIRCSSCHLCSMAETAELPKNSRNLRSTCAGKDSPVRVHVLSASSKM